jgi:hypothetical protein
VPRQGGVPALRGVQRSENGERPAGVGKREAGDEVDSGGGSGGGGGGGGGGAARSAVDVIDLLGESDSEPGEAEEEGDGDSKRRVRREAARRWSAARGGAAGGFVTDGAKVRRCRLPVSNNHVESAYGSST